MYRKRKIKPTKTKTKAKTKSKSKGKAKGTEKEKIKGNENKSEGSKFAIEDKELTTEDLKKAQWYLNKLIDELEDDDKT